MWDRKAVTDEGSLSVKEECVKRDSARLEKGKVYHGNKELYVLIQKAVCEKEGRSSLQTVWNWKTCAREISKSQGSSWAWLLRSISKEVDLANVSSNVVIKVNGKDNMTRKEKGGEWYEIYRALFPFRFKSCYWICYPFCMNWKTAEINDSLSYLVLLPLAWKDFKSQKIQIKLFYSILSGFKRSIPIQFLCTSPKVSLFFQAH